jgi:hypothetical protein
MRGVDRRKNGIKLSHRELDRGHATTLAGDDGLRMRCGRDLLQLSISAHDPNRTFSITKLLGWSLIGTKVVSHARYVALQMAEVAITSKLFADISRMIA